MEHLWQRQPSEGNPAFNDCTYTPGLDLTQFGYTMEEQVNNVSQQAYTVDDSTASFGEPSGNNCAKKKGTVKRNGNYSQAEDEVLISAYLNVSKDAAVGTNQSGKSYWRRISDYYNEHKKTPQSRSQHSLEHRWGDIQKDTTKFCGFYDKVIRLNQSGKSDDDKVKDALQMYEGLIKKPYKFMHCWLMLRHEMKWNAWLSSSDVSDQGQTAQDENTNDTNPNNETTPEAIVRPMGRDRAKKLRSGSTTASNSTACLEILQKFQQDRSKYEEQVVAGASEESKVKIELKERQVKATEELVKLQQAERDDRIMNMDLDKVTPWAREYYIKQQKQIMERTL